MKVGFIGLGQMGSGMAQNLLKAGHELTVYNRTPDKAKALVEKGARLGTSVADACKGDVVITMLADDNAVEHVVFGEKGMLASLHQGAIHISSSTISVALSEKLTAEHTKRGQRCVAAPVFGRPEAAASANRRIRDRVNAFLGGITKPTVTERKAALRSAAMESRELFELFLQSIKEFAAPLRS